jgi:hypothetical protein
MSVLIGFQACLEEVTQPQRLKALQVMARDGYRPTGPVRIGDKVGPTAAAIVLELLRSIFSLLQSLGFSPIYRQVRTAVKVDPTKQGWLSFWPPAIFTVSLARLFGELKKAVQEGKQDHQWIIVNGIISLVTKIPDMIRRGNAWVMPAARAGVEKAVEIVRVVSQCWDRLVTDADFQEMTSQANNHFQETLEQINIKDCLELAEPWLEHLSNPISKLLPMELLKAVEGFDFQCALGELNWEFRTIAGSSLSKTAKGKPPPMRREEADTTARRLADKMGIAFFLLSRRRQAEKIGCHFTTWKKTPFYSDAETRRKELTKQPKKKTIEGPRSAVSFTRELEAVQGEGNRNEVLNGLIEEEENRAAQKRKWEDLSQSERQNMILEQDADDRSRKVRSRDRR